MVFGDTRLCLLLWDAQPRGCKRFVDFWDNTCYYYNITMKENNIVWFLIHWCLKLITLSISLFCTKDVLLKQNSCQSHKKDISAVLSPSCNSALNHFQHVNVHLLWSDEIRSIKEIIGHIPTPHRKCSIWEECINCVSNDRMYRIVRDHSPLNRCILNCIIIMANTNTFLIQ